MKKFILLLVVLMPSVCIAQSGHFDQKNAIKISPAELGAAQFEMAYERYFGDRSSSLVLMPSIFLKDDIRESKEGYQIGAQYRVYLSHLRSDEQSVFLGLHNVGLYAGVYGQYLAYSETYQFSWWDNELNESITTEFQKDVNATEGGAILGVQFDITRKILIDFYIGGGVRYSDFTDTKEGIVDPDHYYDEVSVFDPEYKGVKPRIGFQLGFLF